MKHLVLYKSRYGSTKQYAQFIGDALDCPTDTLENWRHYDLDTIDAMILGEGIYAGKLMSPNILKDIMRSYPDKVYIFFLVGLADMEDAENTDTLYSNLKKYVGDEIEKINVFFLRGAIDYSKLSLKHKSMMWLLYRSLKRKSADALPKDAEDFMESYGKKVDFVEKTTIQPIINYLNAIAEKEQV